MRIVSHPQFFDVDPSTNGIIPCGCKRFVFVTKSVNFDAFASFESRQSNDIAYSI